MAGQVNFVLFVFI